MNVPALQKECRRCGNCCLKGGPALHPEDLLLLEENYLRQEDLLTIRKGEPLLGLTGGNPRPAKAELIKIRGRGTDWTCLFFNRQHAACKIYTHRPLECVLLQCWNTEALEKIAGTNLVSRHDIITSHAPVMPFIEEQQERCPLDMLEGMRIPITRGEGLPVAMSQLTELVNADLEIRSQAHKKLQFSLELELFYFGRPLFVILKQFGIMAREEYGALTLHTPSA